MVRTSLNTPLRRRMFIKPKGSGKDRLSNLPDDLLCRILSELSTKDSVRTSVLSKRWRNLWSRVSALDLDFRYFQEDDDFDMSEFIDGFMKSNKELDLKRFKMIYDVPYDHMHDDFVWRLDQVVKRRVCHLTVLNMVDFDQALVRMPVSLYSCATLVDLTLYCVVFDNPESELVSLPCVKTMYLEAVKFDGNSVLETLISSSPVLEDLTLITYPDDYLEVVCVRSQSLKSFTLESQQSECYDADVEIDAPRLEYMSISDYQSKSFLIHSIGPSAKVDIDVDFDVEYDDPLEITMIPDFLIGISTAREMTISARTLEVIHDYSSEVEALPEFSNLYHLDALLVESCWQVLPTFLGCCMNLHSLFVELDHLPNEEEIKHSPVPQCVLSSLNSLQLKTPKTPSIMRLATHFTKNCTGLKDVLFM